MPVLVLEEVRVFIKAYQVSNALNRVRCGLRKVDGQRLGVMYKMCSNAYEWFKSLG